MDDGFSGISRALARFAILVVIPEATIAALRLEIWVITGAIAPTVTKMPGFWSVCEGPPTFVMFITLAVVSFSSKAYATLLPNFTLLSLLWQGAALPIPHQLCTEKALILYIAMTLATLINVVVVVAFVVVDVVFRRTRRRPVVGDGGGGGGCFFHSAFPPVP